MITVKKVETKKDKNAFIDFQYEVYKDNEFFKYLVLENEEKKVSEKAS